MKTLLAFLALAVVALLVAAAVNYPLVQLLGIFWEVRPDRVLYRSAMVFAAIGLWPLLRHLELLQPARLGLRADDGRAWPAVGRGLLYGVAVLAALGAAQLLLGIRAFRPWDLGLAQTLGKLLVTALAAGLLIGLIEELFFRGVIFAGLRRSNGFVVTAILSSLFYASLHFVRPTPPPETLGWLSGFTMLAGSLHKYATPGLYLDSFVALFFAGLLLAMVRERTGSIFIGLGMHAGWVLVIRLLKKSTAIDHEAPVSQLIGNYDGVIGWLATGWLAALCLVYWRYPWRRLGSG